jgi:beta-glucosidase-like glycosyl hydrolase
LDNQIERIIKEAKKAVTKQMVFEQRLDEAVARILAVKMAMGLV